jgi:hypothetical protein
VCAANVRGIAQSMNLYAADNQDMYPIVAKTGSASRYGPTQTNTNQDTLLSNLYQANPTQMSVLQNMWLLVLTGQVAPKQFVCKSDGVTPSVAASSAGQFQSNFNDGSANAAVDNNNVHASYSIAYAWTSSGTVAIGGWWRNATDAGLPLLADMAPKQGSGGTGTNAAAQTYTNGAYSKVANSLIHQRDGQNVAFGDGHADFARGPGVGQGNDNIFNASAANQSNQSQTAPTDFATTPNVGTGGSAGSWDIALIGVYDGSVHQ